MRRYYSPDRPAAFYERWLGIQDTEPPISDDEYERYVRFRDGIRFAPEQVIASFPPCPRKANRKHRTAIRRLIADPRLSEVLKLMDGARAEHEKREAQLAEQRQAAEAAAQAAAQRVKLEKIDAFYDDQLHELSFRFRDFEKILGSRTIAEATLRMSHDSQSEFTKAKRALNLNLASQGGGGGAVVFGLLAGVENNLRDKSVARGIAGHLSNVKITRSLVAMKEIERATLRMADVLHVLGIISNDECLKIAVPIVWNEGDCAIEFGSSPDFRVRAAMLDTLKPLLASGLSTSAGARERLNQAVRKTISPGSDVSGEQREVIERYLYSGNHWMSAVDGRRALISDPASPSALRLGRFADSDSELLYDLRESLVTVAPPGSGKSQAHVMRNLLYLNAPAVVLDVKGEMVKDTRAWRERSVGKTYVFTPQSPHDSIHYNPLDDIRSDPELAWDDARRLADLLVIPASGKSSGDDYFESRARDMITTALLDVALSTDEERTMASVLDRLYTSTDEEIIAWCSLLEEHQNTQLTRQASALRGMPAKQREGVFDSARRQLEIWQSPAIAKITADTTFNPNALRAENGTLYLAVALEDIKKYASVLRVLIGQTLAKLYRQRPEANDRPVTFFLDELPRLGRMDVIEESLDVGRGYGVRLWMFCQNFGQLKSAYPNAQGMMSNCAVRCYMNPDEDAARWMAENLGTKQGLLDGDRKPLVEAHQLTGPEFAQKVIVFSRGSPPARLDKTPAFTDPICTRRIAARDMTEPVEPASAAPAAATADPAETFASREETETLVQLDWNVIDLDTPKAEPFISNAPAPEPSEPGFNKRLVAAATLGGSMVVAAAIYLANSGVDGSNGAVPTEARPHVARSVPSTKPIEQSPRTSTGLQETIEQKSVLERTLDAERREHAATRERMAALQRQLTATNARGSEAAEQQTASPPSTTVPQIQVLKVAPALPPTAVAPERPTTNWGPLPTPQSAPLPATAPVTDCDLLAGNPTDQNHVGPGAKFSEVVRRAREAVDACDHALSAYPGVERFVYQKARALYAANDPRGRDLFNQLVDSNYPSAFDNAAQYFIREGRMREAERLLRQGVELDDPDAMASLAGYIQDGAVAPAFPGEDIRLFRRSAELGHQGARKFVDSMQDANRAFNAVKDIFLNMRQ